VKNADKTVFPSEKQQKETITIASIKNSFFQKKAYRLISAVVVLIVDWFGLHSNFVSWGQLLWRLRIFDVLYLIRYPLSLPLAMGDKWKNVSHLHIQTDVIAIRPSWLFSHGITSFLGEPARYLWPPASRRPCQRRGFHRAPGARSHSSRWE